MYKATGQVTVNELTCRRIDSDWQNWCPVLRWMWKWSWSEVLLNH